MALVHQWHGMKMSKLCPKCKNPMEKAKRSNRYRCARKRCPNYSRRFH